MPSILRHQKYCCLSSLETACKFLLTPTEGSIATKRIFNYMKCIGILIISGARPINLAGLLHQIDQKSMLKALSSCVYVDESFFLIELADSMMLL